MCGFTREVDVDAAVDAGAQFTLSPGLNMAVVERAKERDVLHIPGVFTASEADTAWQAGCPILKLFPADQGGPAYLKALAWMSERVALSSRPSGIALLAHGARLLS